MSKDFAFMFYPGDYLRDTQCLSPAAQVAYDRIMCEHMRNICISHAQLKFFTKRLTDDERDELMMVLTEENGCFRIEWVAVSIGKRNNYSASRSQNRKGKSKDHMSHTSKSYDNHMEDEDEYKDESIDLVKSEIAVVKKNETAIALNDDYQSFIQTMQEVTGRDFRGDKKSRAQFKARIKDGYTLEDFKRAATAAAATKYHQENQFDQLTPELLTRPDKLEAYCTKRVSSPVNTTVKINRSQTVGEVADIHKQFAELRNQTNTSND